MVAPTDDVHLVGESASLAAALLDHHRVTCRYECFRARRHERDAVLVSLYFLRDSDLHGRIVQELISEVQVRG